MSSRDAAALIAGTAIGGGFLAIPSVTTPMGFAPSAVVLFLVWSFLALCGVALIEASNSVFEADIAAAAGRDSGAAGEQTVEPGVSLASLTQSTFGPVGAVLCSSAFVAQMLAVVTAQVVKAGELLSVTTSVPYAVGCVVASLFAGALTFGLRARLVEGINTTLTAMLLLGFGALLCSTFLGASINPATMVERLSFAKWSLLFPSGSSDWAVPIFLNLLCFGQAVPLVTARMAGLSQNGAYSEQPKPATAKQLARTRRAVLLGSLIPLGLSLLWAAVTSTLLSDTMGGGAADPVIRLVTAQPATALPVKCVAVGAIGTTVISSFLTIEQFVNDALCLMMGGCTPRATAIARSITVGLPTLLACAGPTLYLPLLSFSGAFPTTLLYGLLPPVALFVLRERSERRREAAGADSQERPTALLPGGAVSLGLLGLLAIGMLGTSSSIAFQAVLGGWAAHG